MHCRGWFINSRNRRNGTRRVLALVSTYLTKMKTELASPWPSRVNCAPRVKYIGDEYIPEESVMESNPEVRGVLDVAERAVSPAYTVNRSDLA